MTGLPKWSGRETLSFTSQRMTPKCKELTLDVAAGPNERQKMIQKLILKRPRIPWIKSTNVQRNQTRSPAHALVIWWVRINNCLILMYQNVLLVLKRISLIFNFFYIVLFFYKLVNPCNEYTVTWPKRVCTHIISWLPLVNKYSLISRLII